MSDRREAAAAHGPLSGVRIIDLTAQYSGPIATVLLADQGADVVKVETLSGGDGTRYTQPSRGGMSAMFAAINRNKRSIALDLRAERGKAVLVDLLRGADALVQNFRPGVMERLGFGYETVQQQFPKLIYVSVNGFGATGPYAQRRAYDAIIQAELALPTIQADPDTGEPQMVRQGIVDKVTALMVAQAITAALFARSRDPQGLGQHIEIPMLDTALWFIWCDCLYNHILLGGVPEEPEVVEHLRLRRTRDGYLMVQIVGQEEYNGMCRALGCPQMIQDPRFATPQARYRHLRELNTAFAPHFASFTTEDIYARLMAEDVPVARVHDRRQIFENPQILARGVVEIVPDVTGADMRRVKHPVNFSRTAADARRAAPFAGENTAEILREIGYTDERIESLVTARVISRAED